MLILMNVFQLVYAVQLSKNVDRIDCLLYVYHANILILSARIIQKHMVEEVEILKNRISEGDGRKGINATKQIIKLYGWLRKKWHSE